MESRKFILVLIIGFLVSFILSIRVHVSEAKQAEAVQLVRLISPAEEHEFRNFCAKLAAVEAGDELIITATNGGGKMLVSTAVVADNDNGRLQLHPGGRPIMGIYMDYDSPVHAAHLFRQIHEIKRHKHVVWPQ